MKLMVKWYYINNQYTIRRVINASKITFVMDDEIKKKLDYVRSANQDNRSIQKELEWLINKRYEEVKNG